MRKRLDIGKSHDVHVCSSYRFPISAAEAPSYMRYPGVLGSYRAGGTVMQCLLSLFALHTETVNAWTVIISCVFSIMATSYVIIFSDVERSAIPAFLFFTGASIVHTPFSLGFHLLMPFSVETYNLWRRLDVCAIFVGSSMFTVSLAYFVLPWWGMLINSLISASISLAAIWTFWKVPDDHVLDKWHHVGFVGSIILCYWFPMLIALLRAAIRMQFPFSSTMAVGEFVSLICGGWAFAAHWPQEHAPGKFDVFGHSHQMLHLAAFFGHIFKFLFMYNSYHELQSL